MKAAWVAEYGPLENKFCPSKHLVGLKLEQVEENEPRPELLRDVSSREDAEASYVGANVDDRGVVRIQRAVTPSSRAPKDPEELRIRHRILGNTWVFCKYKHGTRSWLTGFHPGVLPSFSDYILGKHVNGLRFRSTSGREEQPSWRIVMSFEYEVRKWCYLQVVDHGLTLLDAFRRAETNADLRERYLVTPLALDASSRIPVGGSVPFAGGGDLGKGYGRAKGDGKRGNPSGGPYGKGKAKGKGKTPDGRQICYNWNNGTCSGNCGRVHVCLFCLGTHPVSQCPRGGRGAGGKGKGRGRKGSEGSAPAASEGQR